MRPKTLTLIAARARGNVIGRGNTIPWQHPDDMRHFRAQTWDHAIIMGRKTWDSMGRRSLKNRRSIIVSRNETTPPAGDTRLVRSVSEAIELAWDLTQAVPFIIGGAQIYAEAMPLATRIIMTEIDEDHPGDVLFPEIPPAFEETQRHQQGALTFRTLERTTPAT